MLRIYNTLSRSIEEFKPQNPPVVKMYSCGPTVYDYQHIGHMRRYVGDDIVIRVLKLNGYTVHHAMNITDVGHLVSDADIGEDKMEKGAKKFGKSVWDIAKMFETQFKDSCKSLGVKLPTDLMHATDYIQEQIELIKILEQKGFTYQIEDGVYFDSSKFPDYTKLSGQKKDELKVGARVEMVKGKKNPTDFALWKFSKPEDKRQMEWDSPWGRGFPGWHIECSAMSMKALGETLDIHTGGIDHISIHHTNEIAQSEAATGKEFVRYWIHHNFLQVDGQKMSKSLGNFYTVQDVVEKGFDPLALRYLYLQTHYRQEMNFTWEALDGAATALNRLRGEVREWGFGGENEPAIEGKTMTMFREAVNDDLNMPKALAVVWDYLKSDEHIKIKMHNLERMDAVLGLKLFSQDYMEVQEEIPLEVKELVKNREELRTQKQFEEADKLREKIKEMGYEVRDTEGEKPEVRKI